MRADRLARRLLRARPWRPAHFRALADHAAFRSASPTAARDASEGLRLALDWLRRAQDRAGGAGVSAWYSLERGWAPAYPETTGYVLTTFLDAAASEPTATLAPDLRERARLMASWETSVQLPDGSFPGGLHGDPPRPIVFNTGQVLEGLVRAAKDAGEATSTGGTGDPGPFRVAAERAAEWLVSVQDPDGSWPRFEYENRPHAYHTRVAWPLLSAAALLGRDDLRRAAVRSLEWCLGRRRERGWLDGCSFDGTSDPPTHTILYAAEGFLESGALLGDARFVAQAEAMAEETMRAFEIRRGWLPGAFAEGWKATERSACGTGNAQAAIVWFRLHELRGDARFLNAALKMTDLLLAMQSRDRNPDLRGALPGSVPLWGPYMTLRYPNWAAKFLADALLLRLRAEAWFERRPVPSIPSRPMAVRPG